MTKNEAIIASFAAQFVPPMRYIRTERVNNAPMVDAWQCTYWDSTKGVGFTVVAYGGALHAFLEAAGLGTIELAARTGFAFAKALSLLPEKTNGKAT